MTHATQTPTLTLTECPRDAMQGLDHFVPTEVKIEYIKRLLKAQFPILDFGSFVSPKAIPQMADTADVLQAILPYKGDTKLLAIVANLRGAEQAAAVEGVDMVGFPLSVSEEFQKRNTGKTIAEALTELDKITQTAQKAGQETVAYLSMAFGNPYGEEVPPSKLEEHTLRLVEMGIKRIALSDTVGKGDAVAIAAIYRHMAEIFPSIDWVCHLHARRERVQELAQAAWEAGCRNLDVALGGYGGCPLSGDALTGNLDTDEVLAFAKSAGIQVSVNEQALTEARAYAWNVFDAVARVH